MQFLNKIPNWIKNFPIQPDRQALSQLANASKGSVGKPREMNFSLYDFKEGKDLQAAIEKIKEAGWACSTQPQADAPGRLLLTATRKGYVLNEDSYKQDVLFFRRIAQLYGAQYDGWYASN